MYGPQLAAVWDLFYRHARGKDYHGEAEEVADLVRRHHPGAASLLDVACGTGAHLTSWQEMFPDVAGLDLSPAMAAAAREKLPGAPVEVADMREFDLGRSFDAVVCMNTGVAYLPSRADLRAALSRMAGHLSPGGVLVVEPWWFPERYLDGYVAADAVETTELRVTRMSRTTRTGDRARMEIHYLVAGRSGIDHFTEVHSFGLWTRDEYLEAFRSAGCDAEYVEQTRSGYGTFVARARRRTGTPRQPAGVAPD